MLIKNQLEEQLLNQQLLMYNQQEHMLIKNQLEEQLLNLQEKQFLLNPPEHMLNLQEHMLNPHEQFHLHEHI